MSVLAIDIGNSRIGAGVLTHGKSIDPAVRVAHAQADSDLPTLLRALWEKAQAASQEADDGVAGVVIASVNPQWTTRVEAMVEREINAAAEVIGRDLAAPIKTVLRDETTVGQDRLLGALASYVNVEKACVIVQLGSALVVDCVDDEGIFRGGAIAPGLQMAARALHAFAAQLPEVSLTPPEESTPYGRYTQEAINLGIYAGARGTVRELVERYAAALGAWPHVVATGGDASAVLSESGLVDSFVPDLVLQGAALAWEHKRMMS